MGTGTRKLRRLQRLQNMKVGRMARELRLNMKLGRLEQTKLRRLWWLTQLTKKLLCLIIRMTWKMFLDMKAFNFVVHLSNPAIAVYFNTDQIFLTSFGEGPLCGSWLW